MDERRDRKSALSILQDLRKETDVVVGWDARGIEMPDYLRSVWRGWPDEMERGGGCGCMEEDNWKSEMGKTRTIAMMSVVINILLCLYLSVVIFVGL